MYMFFFHMACVHYVQCCRFLYLFVFLFFVPTATRKGTYQCPPDHTCGHNFSIRQILQELWNVLFRMSHFVSHFVPFLLTCFFIDILAILSKNDRKHVQWYAQIHRLIGESTIKLNVSYLKRNHDLVISFPQYLRITQDVINKHSSCWIFLNIT